MSAPRSGIVAAALLLAAGGLRAQVCDPDAARVAVAVASSRVQQARSGMDGWGVGARVEWSPSRQLTARASVRSDFLEGAALRTAGLGASWRLPVPLQPCLALDALFTRGADLNPGDRYRNLTVPVGVLFVRPGSLAFFGGLEVVFSTTESQLLGYRLRDHHFGGGAIAGARLRVGRWFADLVLRESMLGEQVGPQPLGRRRAELSLGFRP